MGKIISDKEISFKASKNALLGIWGNLENVFISEVGKKKLFFCFKDQKKGMQILKRGSWSVRGHMINLQLWKEQSNKGRTETQVHNSENGEWYFAELPNKNNDEEDADTGRDDKTEAWEVELAQNIKARLKLKRKREEREPVLVEYGELKETRQEVEANTSNRGKTKAEETNGANGMMEQQKGSKTDNNQTAEDAGLTMPQPQP
ncbi:hypothetical protein Ahy_B02g060865 [Arachis hypogaea]|uniref:DUF4283 domain-containing protein n=1 Tax=Arachis hypogaea TaxID=3818 RepID=A0A445AJQ1_ARAHY|nr:hypothetical protein Ahy_B02g060865 [Arachis hypogaea]